MSAIDTAKAVLAKASLYDQSFATPDLGIAVAWAEALGDLDKDDALRVVADHYTAETRRIMPADVKAGVRRIRAKRLEVDFEDIPALDAVADDPIEYQRVLRQYRARVAGGWTPPAVEKSNVRAAAVAALVNATANAMPAIPKPDYSAVRVGSGSTGGTDK
jgi:hypothetical protein